MLNFYKTKGTTVFIWINSLFNLYIILKIKLLAKVKAFLIFFKFKIKLIIFLSYKMLEFMNYCFKNDFGTSVSAW